MSPKIYLALLLVVALNFIANGPAIAQTNGAELEDALSGFEEEDEKSTGDLDDALGGFDDDRGRRYAKKRNDPCSRSRSSIR